LTYRFRPLRSVALSTRHLALAALIVGVLAPRAASAVQSAELYRTQAYFYGRFEARIQFAPGEGVVSSFFLWKDGSSSTTSWNELDFEKINATCRLQSNIWTGTGTQSSEFDTPSFNICEGFHTYAFEWTPDYIAWFIDGNQVRKVTGASVAEYTQNASQGMAMHFNVWVGNSSFGGTLNPSILPVNQYVSWAQYSSYANGDFQVQWREEFDGATVPTGWALGTWPSPYNLSTHNEFNVNLVDGVAVLSMTADGMTGYTGTPPADSPDAGPPATGTGGQAGSAGQAGSSSGCSCAVGSKSGGAAGTALLLLAAIAGARRRRSGGRP
jgi:MYXO-CTERM domain-containing protein